MWSIQQSHKWKYVPYYGREIRREMNVREPSQNVILFSRKYFNVETGKFDSERLPTIHSLNWADIVTPDYESCNNNERHHGIYGEWNERRSEKWFVPKDDDFDEEESKPLPKPIDKPLCNPLDIERQVLIQMIEEKKRKIAELEDEYKKQQEWKVSRNKWVVK
jgi:hypothetical protein